jgi:hypothetical protein
MSISNASHVPGQPVDIGDIKTAKAYLNDHVSEHKCSQGDGCAERIARFLGWQRIGAKWGETYDVSVTGRAYRGPNPAPAAVAA